MKTTLRIFMFLLVAMSGFATAWLLKSPVGNGESSSAAQASTTARPGLERGEPARRSEISKQTKRTERFLQGMADARPGDFRTMLRFALDDGDRATVRAVFEKWAEHDLEGLLEFSVENGESRIIENGQTHWYSYILMRAMLARGPEFAMENAARFGKTSNAGSMQWYFVTEITKDSPDLAFRLMLENTEIMSAGGQAQSREAALMLAEKIVTHRNFSASQRIVLKELLKHVKHVDGEKALEFWKQLPDEERLDLMRMIIPSSKPESRSAEAIAIYTEARRLLEESPQDAPLNIHQFMKVYADYMADEGLEANIEWVEARSTGAARQRMLAAVFGAAIERDPLAAQDLLEAQPAGPLHTSMSIRMATEFLKIGTDSAFGFAAELPHDQTGRQAWQRLGWTLTKASSPAEAAKFVADLPDHPGTSEFVRSISNAYVRTEPQAALDWAGSVVGEHRRIAIDTVVGDWMGMDGETAMRKVEMMKDGETRDIAFRALATSLVQTNGASATKWLVSREGADRELARQAIDELAGARAQNFQWMIDLREALR